MRTLIHWMGLLALLGAGCASDVAAPPSPESYGGYGSSSGYDGYGSPAPQPSSPSCDNPPSYAQVTAFTKCAHCHSASKTGAQRNGAPPNVNFDSEAAADAHATAASSAVLSGVMPPKSSGLTLTAAEKQQLYDYAMCKM
jgi:hypothetical protein